MTWLGTLARRLRFLLLRERYSRDLEEEIRLHIELRAARLREQGLSPAAARHAARRRFGNPVNIQERSRDVLGFHCVEQTLIDARFALRRLRRRPGFSLAAITVAALGIGATTAVFSAVDAAMLRPLPFARPEQLVALRRVNIPFDFGEPETARARRPVEIGDVAAMREVFANTAAFAAGGVNLVDAANPERIRAGVVTSGFFATLGARPQLGRTFDEAEGRPKGANVVVLSDALWSRRFGRTPMLGKSIDLNGTRYTVVGIMDRGFNFPNESDLWIPLTVPATSATFAPFRGFLPSRVIARMAPNVRIESASSRLLDVWVRAVGPPPGGKRSYIDETLDEVRKQPAIPLQDNLVGNGQTALAMLMGATVLLLLIACANLANLLLSDSAARQREIALREVLGASSGRITRQLLVESLLLAFAGAVVGLAVAPLVLRVLRAATPDALAGVAPAQLDARVLSFTVLLAVVTGLVFGLWPALGSARGNSVETIKSGALGSTSGGLGRARRVLITAELALTVMLLVGAGLMLRSLDRVLSQDLGLRSGRVGTLELSFPDGPSRAVRHEKLRAIVARLERDPSIESAAIVNDLPLRGGGGIGFSIEAEGQPKRARDDRFARYLLASGAYFETLGIPIVRGRAFTAADGENAPAVAVISVTMAKTWWPNEDALGKRFRLPGDSVAITVVGIAADVRESSLEGEMRPQMYLSMERSTPENVAIVARSALAPSMLLSRLREAVRAVDPSQPVYNVKTMDDVLSTAVLPRRTNTTLIALFGAVALLLSSFGVYAVVSYSVTRRSREFGIRAALGATRADIAALVGREMVGTVVFGLAIGLALAWMLARLMTALLYQVDTHDLPTFMLAPVLLLIPAVMAMYVPARRAMRASPTEVMRTE